MGTTVTKEVQQARFFLTGPGGEATLQSGDELTLLADNSPSNLLFTRSGYGMAIRSDRGELPITGVGKVFSRDEARMLALGLAVASGLSLRESEAKNPVFRGNNIIFQFVTTSPV